MLVLNIVQVKAGIGADLWREVSDATADSVPALGLAWSHCINTRIRILRETSHLRLTSISPVNGSESSSCSQMEKVRLFAGYVDKENCGEVENVAHRVSRQFQDVRYLNEQVLRDGTETRDTHKSSRRCIVVEFSPIRPKRSCNFSIDSSGIKGAE